MKARYFLGIAIIALGFVILGLRYNNTEAGNMRSRILQKDAAGEEVGEDIATLRDFVYTHMVTAGPVQFKLEGAYQRAVARAQLEADNNVNNKIYTDAAKACDREGQLTVDNAKCVQNYIEARLGNAATANLPSEREFSYTFDSPRWIYDGAGIALATAIISLIIATGIYLRYLVKKLL